jgi:hypothetical protein
MAAALVASASASTMRAPGEKAVVGKRHAGLVPSRDEIRRHQLKNDGLNRHVFVLPPSLHVADQSLALALALGVDISEPMLARAVRAEAVPQIGFLWADAQRLPRVTRRSTRRSRSRYCS